MNLTGVAVGDVVQFITKVDHSRNGQPIQNVILKVTEITPTHIRGVNAMRSLELDTDARPFRSYKLENLVGKTVWKLIA